MRVDTAFFVGRQVVILSPHVDDAFISLGGLLPMIARSSDGLCIFNVFSDTRYTAIGPSEFAFSIRKEEESSAQRLLEIDVEVRDLGLPDASLRVDGAPHPSVLETTARDAISTALGPTSFAVGAQRLHLIPAGIGEHVDHVAVRAASRKLLNTATYFELPYALDVPSREEPNIFVFPIDAALHVRVMECFRSQYLPRQHDPSRVIAYLEGAGGIRIGVPK